MNTNKQRNTRKKKQMPKREETDETGTADIMVLYRAPAAIVYNAPKGMLIKNTDDDPRVDFITLSGNRYRDYKHILQDHMEESAERAKSSLKLVQKRIATKLFTIIYL